MADLSLEYMVYSLRPIPLLKIIVFSVYAETMSCTRVRIMNTSGADEYENTHFAELSEKLNKCSFSKRISDTCPEGQGRIFSRQSSYPLLLE